MNKIEFKAEADRLLGTFSDENLAEYALSAEQFINYPNEDYFLPKIAVALADYRIRDYILGVMDKDNPTHVAQLHVLATASPKKYLAPALTLLGILYAEQGDNYKALNYFRQCEGYNLAMLIAKFLNSGFPLNVDRIRSELHQKVKESVFGKALTA